MLAKQRPEHVVGVRLRCRSAADTPVGSQATLSVRYKRVGMANGAADAAVVRTVVTDRTFMGAAVRVTRRTAGGLALVTDLADVESAGKLLVGAPWTFRSQAGE